MSRRLVALGIVLAATGCAREPREVAWVGDVGPEALEGEVRRVGSHPFSQALLTLDDGESAIVTGAYEAEIERLAGARVRVTGRWVRGELPEPSLEASSYEIVSIEGDRPWLGRLARDDAGFFLEASGGATRRLSFVSETLAEQIGALVWIVVDERDGVARYGILREPIS